MWVTEKWVNRLNHYTQWTTKNGYNNKITVPDELQKYIDEITMLNKPQKWVHKNQMTVLTEPQKRGIDKMTVLSDT